MCRFSALVTLLLALVLAFGPVIGLQVRAQPPEIVMATGPLDVDEDIYINANNILMMAGNRGGFGWDTQRVFNYYADTFYYRAGTFYPYQSIQAINDGSLATAGNSAARAATAARVAARGRR